MTYLDFLKRLLALGPKLPQVMALVQHIVSDVQEIVALITGTEPVFGESPMELSGEEQKAEDKVVAALADSGNETFGAIGDGTFLRQLFEFIRTNPQLLQLIISLLAK